MYVFSLPESTNMLVHVAKGFADMLKVINPKEAQYPTLSKWIQIYFVQP